MAQLFDVPTGLLLRAVPVLFAGLFAGVVLAPLTIARLDGERAVAVGALLQAAALLAMASSARPAGFLAGAAATGVGFGLTEAAATSLTNRLRATSSRALTGLTAVTAAAAALTPVAVVVAGEDLSRAVLALAAVPHLLAATVLGRDGAKRPRAVTARTGEARDARVGWLAAALFCYVGAETVVSGWSASLAQGLLDLSPATAALGTSAFWVLLMLGRLASSVALDRGLQPASLLLLCQLGAASCLAGAAFAVYTAANSPLLTAGLLGLAVALCQVPGSVEASICR